MRSHSVHTKAHTHTRSIKVSRGAKREATRNNILAGSTMSWLKCTYHIFSYRLRSLFGVTQEQRERLFQFHMLLRRCKQCMWGWNLVHTTYFSLFIFVVRRLVTTLCTFDLSCVCVCVFFMLGCLFVTIPVWWWCLNCLNGDVQSVWTITMFRITMLIIMAGTLCDHTRAKWTTIDRMYTNLMAH